jgi:hypothetical protein
MNRSRITTAVCALILFVFPAGRSTGHAAQGAQQIVEEAQKRTVSKSKRYEGLLQTFDTNGKASEKRWIFERLGSHGRSKSIIRFTAPAEVRNVTLLILNNPDRPSDQWMWTPAIERDRRIALQDRSTRFFGTDFSFEDLEEWDVDQFRYTLVGEEAVDGAVCWKIHSIPRPSRSSQYSKSIVWIRQDNYAFARIDSYVGNEVARRLHYSDFQNVQGIWTAREAKMTDLRRPSITRLALDKIEYNLPLHDDKFTVQSLRRP